MSVIPLNSRGHAVVVSGGLVFHCRLSILLWCIVFVLADSELRGAVVFSALEEGRWIIHYQERLDSTPVRVATNIEGDQTAGRFGATEQGVAFETTSSRIHIFRRSGEPAVWSSDRVITNAVRPAWHSGVKGWVFPRFMLLPQGEDSDLFLDTGGAKGTESLVHHTGNQDYPHVSSDGMKLAYTSTEVVSVRRGVTSAFQRLWVIDFQRGTTRPLDIEARENIESAWSPSGEELAFASNKGGQFEIWIIRADGRNLRQLTSGPGTKSRPAWSPDGKRLLFARFLNGRHDLAFVDADGKNLAMHKPFGENRVVELRDADWK